MVASATARRWRFHLGAIKLRLGYVTLAEDLAALRAVQKRVPTGTVIMSDYNQALTVTERATPVRHGVWAELTIVPFVLAILRYALLLEQGQGGAPEDPFPSVHANDRGPREPGAQRGYEQGQDEPQTGPAAAGSARAALGDAGARRPPRRGAARTLGARALSARARAHRALRARHRKRPSGNMFRV